MMLEVCKGDYVTPKMTDTSKSAGNVWGWGGWQGCFYMLNPVCHMGSNKQKRPRGRADGRSSARVYYLQITAHRTSLPWNWNKPAASTYTHSCMGKWAVSCKLMSVCTGKEGLNAGRPWVRTKEIYLVLEYKNCTLKPKSHMKVHSL